MAAVNSPYQVSHRPHSHNPKTMGLLVALGLVLAAVSFGSLSSSWSSDVTDHAAQSVVDKAISNPQPTEAKTPSPIEQAVAPPPPAPLSTAKPSPAPVPSPTKAPVKETAAPIPAVSDGSQSLRGSIPTAANVKDGSPTKAEAPAPTRPPLPDRVETKGATASAGDRELDQLVHLIHTTPVDTFQEKHVKCVESIFYHNPDATVILHARDTNFTLDRIPALQALVKKTHEKDASKPAYKLEIQHYDIVQKVEDLRLRHFNDTQSHLTKDFLEDDRIRIFLDHIPEFIAQTDGFWKNNESNLLRFILLYLQGGIYLDSDVIVVRSLKELPPNSLGYHGDETKKTLNNAILKFDPHHPYIASCLEFFIRNFKNHIWGQNGPFLATTVFGKDTWREMAQLTKSEDGTASVTILPKTAFYYFDPQSIEKDCFEDTTEAAVQTRLADIGKGAFVVHLSKMGLSSSANTTPGQGTACQCLIQSYCLVSNCTAPEACQTLRDTASEALTSTLSQATVHQ